MNTNDIYIKSFLDYITNERNYSYHTIRSYKNDLKNFSEFLNKYDCKLNIVNIDRSAIQFYIQSISKKN